MNLFVCRAVHDVYTLGGTKQAYCDHPILASTPLHIELHGQAVKAVPMMLSRYTPVISVMQRWASPLAALVAYCRSYVGHSDLSATTRSASADRCWSTSAWVSPDMARVKSRVGLIFPVIRHDSRL